MEYWRQAVKENLGLAWNRNASTYAGDGYQVNRKKEYMKHIWTKCPLAVLTEKHPKLIAFTFDDGPSQYTEVLLDGLNARNAQVTFFMNGENGTGGSCGIKNGHQALLPRMWEDGHQLANHTYRHTDLGGLSAEQIASEVAGVEKLIFDMVGGGYQCFVRTPNGHVNEAVTRSVNVPIISWSVDTLDWKYRDADYVYNKILSCAENGSIVLMHDIYETSIKGALCAIDTLKEQGYELVTVSELMRRTSVHLTGGTVYAKAGHRHILRPAYKAPMVTVSKKLETGTFTITCPVSAGLPVYYTTDGSYPRLSDNLYDKAVSVKPGTVFTAVGIDPWGTRTPPTIITVDDDFLDG